VWLRIPASSRRPRMQQGGPRRAPREPQGSRKNTWNTPTKSQEPKESPKRAPGETSKPRRDQEYPECIQEAMRASAPETAPRSPSEHQENPMSAEFIQEAKKAFGKPRESLKRARWEICYNCNSRGIRPPRHKFRLPFSRNSRPCLTFKLLFSRTSRPCLKFQMLFSRISHPSRRCKT
jgi:hypothetical protein